jgi:2-hydroxy-3-keto-5-methylthiopentenyl-1-phosphate phosphatase
MAFGIHMHYKKIVKKVLDNGKLDVFIENFAKSGKKEDCPYYCIKNGSFM